MQVACKVKLRKVCLGGADVGSAESPTTAARAHAAGRGGHFGAFFSQVKDAASKVQACACTTCKHYLTDCQPQARTHMHSCFAYFVHSTAN